MIPIVSIANGISFLISFAITISLLKTYRTSSWPDPYIRYFLYSFFVLTIFFFTIATPGIVSNDGMVLAIFNAISVPLAMIAAALFAQIPIRICSKNKRILGIYFAGVIVAIAISFILRILSLDPLEAVQRGNFTYWVRQINDMMIISFIISGLVMGSSVLGSGIFFIVYAIRSRTDSYLFKRALFIGNGFVLLGLASLTNYLLGAVPNPYILIISGIVADIGLLSIGIAVAYRVRKGSIGPSKEHIGA